MYIYIYIYIYMNLDEGRYDPKLVDSPISPNSPNKPTSLATVWSCVRCSYNFRKYYIKNIWSRGKSM